MCLYQMGEVVRKTLLWSGSNDKRREESDKVTGSFFYINRKEKNLLKIQKKFCKSVDRITSPCYYVVANDG